MSRVKKGTIANKTRRSTLSKTKGYRFGRSTKEKEAKTAIMKAGSHAFAHRKDKKNDFRRLWQVRISAATKQEGLSYSKFIDGLKKNKIDLDRKVLANLAQNHREIFQAIVAKVK
jgi:large subunit ribosomal protein L20